MSFLHRIFAGNVSLQKNFVAVFVVRENCSLGVVWCKSFVLWVVLCRKFVLGVRGPVGFKNKAEQRVETARQGKCGPENVVFSCWKVIILLLTTNSI